VSGVYHVPLLIDSPGVRSVTACPFEMAADRLSQKRRVPAAWLMGLSSASFGLHAGFLAFTLPQALAAQHVPEPTIAMVTALAFTPGFLVFLVSPILDVRFSRRWYATVLTAIASVLVGVCVMNLHHLLLLETAAVAGFAAICLAYGALGGWLSTVVGKENENQLSAWLTAANVGAGGIISMVGAEVILHLPLAAAALLLGSVIMLPASVFVLIPAPGPDRRLADESFRAFRAEIFALLRRRQVLIALALFLAPCGTFSLVNILYGLGNDFHASPRVVSLLGGVGVVGAALCGSLLFPTLAKRMPLRPLYLTIGAVGGLFTLGLILLPRTSGSFALILIDENIFQTLAITCSVAIAFETIGPGNPLAATTFAILNAAYNFPISYMPVVDGWGYSRRGVAGAFAADAGTGIAACLLLGLALFILHRVAPGRSTSVTTGTRA
jgi:MFS transporter, PAT family, beta-lactamase induction signal transducer AmpG